MSERGGYAQYYQRALDHKANGYKTVIGGTGLGKTHGVVQCIKTNQHSRKFIYVSHRHNLLEEMAEKLNTEKITYCYLKSDAETLRQILKRKTGFSLIQAILEDDCFKEYVRYCHDNLNQAWKFKVNKCLDHLVLAKKILEIQANATFDSLEALSPDDAFQKESSKIFSFFKEVIRELSEAHSYLSRRNPGDNYSKYNFTIDDLPQFVARHEIIFELFPFWRFERDPQTSTLLITIQKLFSGFFDGKRNTNIYKIKDKVIFLDEFEFLEPVLLDKIIAESKLDNPFTFIAYFYHNISIKLLDKKNYLRNHPELRSQIETICNKIELLKKSSNFPDIRFFGVKDEKVLNKFVGSGLYQANYTSVDQPIYLEVDEGLMKYWLNKKQVTGAPTTFNLIRSIKRITNDILQFYLSLKTENDKLYFELLEDAYEKTDYVHHINKLSFFSVIPPRRKSTKGSHRINNFSYLYHRGYSLYVLNKPSTEAEPNEVFLDFLMVNSSPERCLLGLVQKNFVFGMSATATLTRYLEHFNLKWIKDEIESEKDESLLFLDVDDEDLSIIRQLSEEKARKRNNSLELSIAKNLCRDEMTPILKELKESSRFKAVSSMHDYHIDRLAYFFNTLDWIMGFPLSKRKINTIDSHILFFNSLRQIRAVLDCEINLHPKMSVELVGPFQYVLQYFGQNFKVILLDSKAHRYFFDTTDGKSAYEQSFNLSTPILLITQYPSANNGVNLQYYVKTADGLVQQDYQSIHLLEAPHFYFSSSDSRTEDDIKSDTWKLAQLFLAGKIQRSDFNARVKGIMNRTTNLNTLYKRSTDYTLNQVAKVIQALGRIERVRNRHVGLQRCRISNSVLSIFNRYFNNQEIQTIIADSSPSFSRLVQLFIAEVNPYTKAIYDKNEKERPLGILSENEKCKVCLDLLAKGVSEIQSGKLPREETLKKIEFWREIRKSALSFEFQSWRIRENHGLFFNQKIKKTTQILWDEKTGKVYDENDSPSFIELQKWNFNAHFQNITQFEEVRKYFHSQGFELEFIDHLNFLFFTPIFFQSVYLGALGEEATKAIFHSFKEIHDKRLFRISYPEEIDLSLFEVVDFHVEELNWFVDAKFYSQKNMSGGQIAIEQKKTAPNKLNKIKRFNRSCKLILVNANGRNEGHTTFFNSSFELADEALHQIVVFPSLYHLRDHLINWAKKKDIVLSGESIVA